MGSERMVRGRSGRLASKDLKDHGFDLQSIKHWRETEYDAGRPSTVDEFFTRHGLCAACQSRGVRMIGWSDPSAAEMHIAKQLNLEKLPLYEICATCGGTGTLNPMDDGDGTG